MAAARKKVSGPSASARREIGPFERAALTGRFIGVAGLAFGGLLLSAAHAPTPVRQQGEVTIHYVIAAGFIVPGLLYLILSTWVARKRRWAVALNYGFTMLGMTLLGMLCVLLWGGNGAWTIILPAALFVVASATLMMYLRRSLELLNRPVGLGKESLPDSR